MFRLERNLSNVEIFWRLIFGCLDFFFIFLWVELNVVCMIHILVRIESRRSFEKSLVFPVIIIDKNVWEYFPLRDRYINNLRIDFN